MNDRLGIVAYVLFEELQQVCREYGLSEQTLRDAQFAAVIVRERVNLQPARFADAIVATVLDGAMAE